MGDETRDGGTAGTEQMTTGVPGLDRLLGGGLRRRGLNVVLGGPGAGKSVLAHQIGAHLIRGGGKVLYLTGLVETHQTLISQARTFRFFDPSVVPDSFYYASLYPTLAKSGLQGAREEISRLVVHHGPDLVILDGVHALKVSAESKLEYQRFMHEMEAQSAVSGITTLILTHPDEGMAADPTFTIADGIFHLRTEDVGLRKVRMFSVEKLRGVAHLGGWHTFAITSDGLRIYPRLEALTAGCQAQVTRDAPRPADGPLLDFAVEGLGEMLGGGLDPGSATLVVGTPGSGKTLLGLSFLGAGAEAGEPGLLLSFHERPDALVRKGEGVGLPLDAAIRDGVLHLHWRLTSELLMDEMAERLLQLVDEHGIRRLAIDAIEDVSHAVIPPERNLFFIASLVGILRDRGVTLVALQDLTRIVGLNFDMPMPDLAALMDNVLHLRFVEMHGELQRLVSVLKVRARDHDRGLHRLEITARGMRVGDTFAGVERVLTGLGHSR
ncbi:MAG TPA: ATPase domain-containing protein [Longimicrobiaceae bacterium]